MVRKLIFNAEVVKAKFAVIATVARSTAQDR
jgi:hypothetical protein